MLPLVKSVGVLALGLGMSVMCGCRVQQYSRQFTPVDSVACEAEPGYIYPFLEGEPIQFAYSRIGKVVVESSSNKFKLDMMTQLMNVASSKCANAVVGIYIDDVFKKDKYGFTARKPRISGIAVRVNEDSLFQAKYKLYRKDLTKSNPMAPYSRDTAKQNLAYAIGITLSISLIVLLSLMTL